jgi:hypothetical protein
VVDVERWAEIRRMHLVEGRSIKEIARRTGHSRNTIRAALRNSSPPRYGPRAPRPSKLDPFKPKIHQLLGDDARIPSQVIRERITELGYEGGKTIADDYVRELRPVFAPPRSFQPTSYEPGELFQFDLWEPSQPIPVGHGQLRRGYVVTCCSGSSRAGAGTLVLSKEWPDLAWGMSRCLARLGALPEKLVWDREGGIAPRGRPTDEFAAFCGSLGVGWIILDAGDAPARGVLERLHDFIERSFEPDRRFANELDYQDQLDCWFDERANPRLHRTLRERPIDRLAGERCRMRPLPAGMPQVHRRFVIRVPKQPYLRFDRNDSASTPASPGDGWRSGSPSGRSERWRSIPASSPAAIGAPSPATSPSPIPPTSGSWSACGASAAPLASRRSSDDPWTATTP